jgi:hypothetical protein
VPDSSEYQLVEHQNDHRPMIAAMKPALSVFCV